LFDKKQISEDKMSQRLTLNTGLVIVIIFSLFGLFVNDAYAYLWIVTISTPGGNVDGVTYEYDSQVDNIYTAAAPNNTQYYISVYGRVWGSCSPDMTGCTYNRWKVKDQASSVKWWSTATDIPHINSNGLLGIGIARHTVQYRVGNPIVSKYTTEHGTSTSNGASSGCYNNGPALNANTTTGLACP
jgi:hypothetical protein